MNIHLAAVKETELTDLLPLRAASSQHLLVSDPATADLILLIGSFGVDPQLLLDHPLYRRFPQKCAVYTEDDNYLPLAPGVYCSARVDRSSRSGRVFSYSYVSSRGQYSNPYVAADAQAAEKRILFSFQGGSTSLLRKRLFNLRFDRPDVLIENTSTYFHWDLDQPGRDARQKRYAETLAASHFVLCPRGAGTGSIRLFEVMSAGIAPVLLSDDYVLPPDVDWSQFLLRFPERDIRRLPELLEPYRPLSAERGRLAFAAWQKHFAPEVEFDAIVALSARSLEHGPPDEAIMRKRQARLIARANLHRKTRGLARAAVLRTLKLLGLRSPYQMNR